MMQQLVLTTGWQLRQRDATRDLSDDFAAAEGWIPASAPGSVHQDLLAAGLIPDPFIGLNELDVQWVGEADWLYRCAFELPADFAAAGALALCLDGLDTFATVWLNDTPVLTSDNMFVPQRVPIGQLAQAGANELRILFESALRRGHERAETYGDLRVWNGDASRVYVRKAQYHYGWDWGPTLMTAGPWRPVRLEAFSARIAEIDCPAEVADDLGSARLPVRVQVELAPGAPSSGLSVRLELFGPAGEQIASATAPVKNGAAQHTLAVEAPQLWWPHGYGEQPLYRVVATLERTTTDDRRPTTERAQGAVVGAQSSVAEDTRELRLGLRRLRLVQEPLENEPGT